MTHPALTLTQTQARRFLLAYQGLLPPHQYAGKDGILEFLQRVGCIQFDPVNAVGRNPELVLQARLHQYRPQLLEELLYQDRLLVDGWDKVASIHLSSDWPGFNRHRLRVRQEMVYPGGRLPQDVLDIVYKAIAERGPLSSLELERLGNIQWHWGVPVRTERAALETLYGMGVVGIHHRAGSRRYYDLMERLLPQHILEAEDPNPDLEAHLDWHVLRRIGGLGLASNSAGEHWLAIHQLKSKGRTEVLQRLVSQGKVVEAGITGLNGKKYYLRSTDQALLETINSLETDPVQVTFLGPLDNLLWDRDLVQQVFNFKYIWEIYKPPALRSYGFYTMPVLAGDRFIARFSPIFVTKTRTLRIDGWWWEENAAQGEDLSLAIRAALQDFFAFLGAEKLQVSTGLSGRPDLKFLV